MCYKKFGLEGVKVGLFCETYPDLRDRQISKMKLEFPPWLGSIKETKEDGLCFFLPEYLGGGAIALRNLDDPTKYQSAEFAAIGVDELTKIVKETFDILRGSLRWPGISWTVFMGATNPGGIGHLWVKDLWVDSIFPPEMLRIADQFKFIQSLPADNPYLDDQYWEDLNSLPDDLRKAWVEGSWDIFAGMAIPGWSRAKHVIEPISLPAWWPRWRAVDWGFAKPFCCLWACQDPDRGRIYIYREEYQVALTDRQQARLIRSHTPPEEKVHLTYADPSMWTRKNMLGKVTSTADEYAAEGVFLTKADNDRRSGKRKIDRILCDLPDGQPGVQVFSTCIHLIRTLPALPYDKVRVEDVDTKAEDHAYDTFKYLLSNFSPHTEQRSQEFVQRSPIERIAEL